MLSSRSWMATRLLAGQYKVLVGSQARCMGHGPAPQPIKVDIGTREVVGYGNNGEEKYFDHNMYPFPAIRFQEDSTGNIAELRKKEKGDWKKMTLEDKKGLYRASFANTFEEINASTPHWKLHFAILFSTIGIALWVYIGMVKYVYPPLPDTVTNEKKVLAQLHRMVKLNMEPITGVPAQYDYEKKQWK